MMADNREATETSPLLAKSPVSEPVTVSNDTSSGTLANGRTREDRKPTGDEENPAEDGDRAGQYEGMPEVKAKLKYILPAVGIGVWYICRDAALTGSDTIRSSYLRQIRLS